jgi:hypothetical protein
MKRKKNIEIYFIINEKTKFFQSYIFLKILS